MKVLSRYDEGCPACACSLARFPQGFRLTSRFLVRGGSRPWRSSHAANATSSSRIGLIRPASTASGLIKRITTGALAPLCLGPSSSPPRRTGAKPPRRPRCGAERLPLQALRPRRAGRPPQVLRRAHSSDYEEQLAVSSPPGISSPGLLNRGLPRGRGAWRWSAPPTKAPLPASPPRHRPLQGDQRHLRPSRGDEVIRALARSSFPRRDPRPLREVGREDFLVLLSRTVPFDALLGREDKGKGRASRVGIPVAGASASP